MSNKSKLSVKDVSAISVGLLLIVLGVIFIAGYNKVTRNFDAMSAQIEELSEDVNANDGYCRVVSKSYVGVLESVVTQADDDEVEYYIVVGGCYITVSELEYLKAKDNIGTLVTVETESKETKSASGHFTSTYSVVVTYEEDQ